MVFQSPGPDAFSTMAISVNAKTGVTLALLVYDADNLNKWMIKALKGALADISHPLLLPTIFFRVWVTRLAYENNDLYDGFYEMKRVVRPVSDPAKNPTFLSDINKAHEFIVENHNVINNSLTRFVAVSAVNLQEALDRISDIVTDSRMDTIRRSHKDIQALVAAWVTTVNGEIDVRTRMRERLSMQLQVLYNIMQREDSKSSKMMAESSNRIAEDTRNDSKAMKSISEQSKQIAEYTQLDSAAMKTIAALSMAFLPGTAVAVRSIYTPPSRLVTLKLTIMKKAILSMGSFFQSEVGGSIVVSPKFWVYWLVTIPVTLAVFGSWGVWT